MQYYQQPVGAQPQQMVATGMPAQQPLAAQVPAPQPAAADNAAGPDNAVAASDE